MGLEIEQWLIPVPYRPQPGDRIHAVGRWIVDCGHDDWHTELHPVELVESWHAIPPQASTDGNPATETSVVITGAWQGGSEEFDVWPLARPHATARLRIARTSTEADFMEGILNVSEVALPPDNPNHLHVHVTAPEVSGRPINRFGQMGYDPHLRFTRQYQLWWEIPLRPPTE